MWSNHRRSHCQSIFGDLPWLFEEVGKDGCTNHDESALKYYCSSIPEGESKKFKMRDDYVFRWISARLPSIGAAAAENPPKWHVFHDSVNAWHVHPIFNFWWGEPDGLGRYLYWYRAHLRQRPVHGGDRTRRTYPRRPVLVLIINRPEKSLRHFIEIGLGNKIFYSNEFYGFVIRRRKNFDNMFYFWENVLQIKSSRFWGLQLKYEPWSNLIAF